MASGAFALRNLFKESPFYATQFFISLGAFGSIYNAARNGDGERPELTAYLRTDESHGLQAQRAPVLDPTLRVRFGNTSKGSVRIKSIRLKNKNGKSIQSLTPFDELKSSKDFPNSVELSSQSSLGEWDRNLNDSVITLATFRPKDMSNTEWDDELRTFLADCKLVVEYENPKFFGFTFGRQTHDLPLRTPSKP